MEINKIDVSEADSASAQIFFTALRQCYDLSYMNALDMFARDGQLTVMNYHKSVKNLDVWELNGAHRDRLSMFRPRDLQIGDSYSIAEKCTRNYDLVVIDTPQGIHTDATGKEHVEHFDALRLIERNLSHTAIVVLYVNRNPYNKNDVGDHGYDNYEVYDYGKWMDARKVFYGQAEITEDIALCAYRAYFGTRRRRILSTLLVPCFSDVPGLPAYAFRIALETERF